MIWIPLYIVALLLQAVLKPIGKIYGFLRYIITLDFKGLVKYLEKLSKSIDQHGNVILAPLMNDVLLKGRYTPFGHEDDTISEIIGFNIEEGTANKAGIGLGKFLDFFDEGHCKKAAENYRRKLKD